MHISRRLTGVMVLGSFLSLSIGCGDDDRHVIDAGGADGGVEIDAFVPDDGGGLDAPWTMDGALDGGMADAGSDAGTAIDAGMPLELVQMLFCEPLARAMCSAPWDCGCPRFGPRPEDEAACAADAVSTCISSFASSETGAGARAGRVAIDVEELARCGRRAELSYSACSGTFTDMNAWCNKAFIDTVPLGTHCTGEAPLCAGGAGSCLFEVCSALPGAGAGCDEFSPLCAGDLVCFGGVCGTARAAGESCVYDSQCADDLLCVGGACATMFVPEGSTCSDTADCAAGTSCEGTSCTAPSTVPASCSADDECPSLQFCETEYESRCMARVPVGSRCYGTEHCTPDAMCDFSTELCAARPGAGGPCPEGICADGLQCYFDGYCRTLGNVGEACAISDNDGCVEGLSCVAGACAIPPGDGEACADDGECADGLECEYDPSGATICAPPRNSGEACTGGWDGNDCYPGLFCDYVSGLCTDRRGPGADCNGATDECVDGYDCVYDDTSGISTCQPVPAIGGLCSFLCTDGAACVYAPTGGTCTARVCYELPDFGGAVRPDDPPPRPRR